MTREQKRARRDIINPGKKTKIVKEKRSSRCTCPSNCKKHGIFLPLSKEPNAG